ncbi:MAG TPA: phytanoyl-CoA dioxygenase family protein [Acidimicrobiia bacterium]|nr:phytanoyl-CoA dioxygenase family protein [Acidimicrobiia bacterium]
MDHTRHPWNRDFTWEPHRAGGTVTAEQARQYDELGYFVVEDAFDARVLAGLDEELSRGDARVKEFLAGVEGGRFSVAGLDTQVVAPHAVTRSEYLRAFAAHPVFAGLARDLIGPNVRLYWDQSVYKQPNSAEPVLWHQDNGYTYVEPQAYVTCWIAITDATPDNGCIAVMPGAHRDGTLAHHSTPIGEECWGDWSSAVEVPVRAGSVVVFSSLTPHATKRNTTTDVRKAYILQYAPDGAVVLRGDPALGPATHREPCDHDDRQYWIVREGSAVAT